MRFLLQSFVSRSFLVHLRKSFFYFFFHLFFFDGVHFQYSQILVNFLCSYAFLIWLFRSSNCFSLPTFHYQNSIFFGAKFHSYILTVYSYCSHHGLEFFYIFGKYLDIIHVHFVTPYVFPKYIVKWHYCFNTKLEWEQVSPGRCFLGFSTLLGFVFLLVIPFSRFPCLSWRSSIIYSEFFYNSVS